MDQSAPNYDISCVSCLGRRAVPAQLMNHIKVPNGTTEDVVPGHDLNDIVH